MNQITEWIDKEYSSQVIEGQLIQKLMLMSLQFMQLLKQLHLCNQKLQQTPQ